MRLDYEVSCYCGSIRTTTRLSPSSPSSTTIPAIACHCHDCRHISGALFTTYLPIDRPPNPSVISQLTGYASSKSVRLFCSQCGAHMYRKFEHSHEDTERWFISSGVLDTENLPTSLESHQYVGETHDGGLSTWLPRLAGSRIPSWEGAAEESRLLPHSWPEETNLPDSTNRDSDILPASCHCGGVSFYLTRPDMLSARRRTTSFPELLRDEDDRANPEGEPWWLPKGIEGGKYLAGLCTCESCRKATGCLVQTWAFVPATNVHYRSDSGSRSDSDYRGQSHLFRFGTGGTGEDSEDRSAENPVSTLVTAKQKNDGIWRDFCGRCGATVTWRGRDRQGIVDISVGLFSGVGARVEDWFEWGPKVSYGQEVSIAGLSAELGAALEKQSNKL